MSDGGDTPAKPQRLLLGLQYLRAVAAIAVVYYHSGGPTGRGFAVGQAGVDLFFLLSGFLMVSITRPGFSPRRFLRDRARRIVPLYWIATSVMVAGTLAGLFPRAVLVPWHVIASYLFIPAWSPSEPTHVWPLMVVGWTLSYEAAFYLIFAATAFLATQARQMAVITGLFALLVLVGRLHSSSSAIYTAYTDPILLEFVAGGWMGLLWKRPGAWPVWLGWPAIALALVVLSFFDDESFVPWRVLAFGLPCLILLLSVLALERRGAIGRVGWLLLLGNASYSIYLFHPFAASVARALDRSLHLAPFVHATIGLTLGLIVGMISYMLIEKPIIARSKN